MPYTSADMAYVQKAAQNSSSKHATTLAQMVAANVSYAEIFSYGQKYLPHIRDEKNGRINLDKLADYKPEIVEYFDVVAEMPSLPDNLKDLATNLAIYANG